MTLGFLGDIHGDAPKLRHAAQQAKNKGATALIQVGDFGVYPSMMDALVAAAQSSPIPIYFIDGNHEHYPIINSWPSRGTKEIVAGKLTYVRRGEVLVIDGVRVGFLGGAGSIDHNYRTAGVSWFPMDEQIKDDEVDALLAAGPVDVLVTHTPPRSFIDAHFDTSPIRAALARKAFGASPDWTDPSADRVERAWVSLGRPPLYCGHMHIAIATPEIRLLGIDELAIYQSPDTP